MEATTHKVLKKTFLCCMTAREGTIVVGIIYLISAIFASGAGGISLVYYIIQGRISRKLVIGAGFGFVILSLINVYLSLRLLYGVKINSPSKCKAFYYYNVLLTSLWAGISSFLIIIPFLMTLAFAGVSEALLLLTLIPLGMIAIVCGIVYYLLHAVSDYIFILEYTDYFKLREGFDGEDGNDKEIIIDKKKTTIDAVFVQDFPEGQKQEENVS